MSLFISNAFSVAMLNSTDTCVRFQEITLSKVKELIGGSFVSAVGHQATADVIAMLTGVEVPVNRVSVSLKEGDQLVVFQLLSRLPEGVILTAEEVQKIPHKWYLVTILPDYTLEAVYHW